MLYGGSPDDLCRCSDGTKYSWDKEGGGVDEYESETTSVHDGTKTSGTEIHLDSGPVVPSKVVKLRLRWITGPFTVVVVVCFLPATFSAHLVMLSHSRVSNRA